MKIRNGLVSNSSTTSFVFVGYIINDDLKELTKLINTFFPTEPLEIKYKNDALDYIYRIPNNTDQFDVYVSSGNIYVGALIATISDDDNSDGLSNEAFDISNLMSKCNKANEKFKFKEEPKLYTGTDDN